MSYLRVQETISAAYVAFVAVLFLSSYDWPAAFAVAICGICSYCAGRIDQRIAQRENEPTP